MDDYIRREAAKAQIRKAYTRIEDRVAINCVLNDVPAADVVPVVRCRDCLLQRGCKSAQYLGDDGYCSRGERKEEEDEEVGKE